MSLFSLAGVVLGTVSWFVANNQTPKELNIKGQSAGAYFAYGDGLPYEVDGEGKVIHRPYGISVPRHLYNLSWLQYMGQFDDGQYYFELADNVPEDGLDMSGYVLPPIGTEEKPFVGNFNGKGKIIKNLTVTNDEDELFNSQKHPDQTQVTYEAPEIVGLFGVVGNYNDAYEGTYETSINSIHDLGISNISVQTTTNKALVGIAAGYVDATISNVAVNESTVNVETANTAAVDATNLTANLSDYGVVGYATDDYKKSITKLEENLYDITFANPANAEFNATDDGDSQGWGGSINMKTIYQRLYGLKHYGVAALESHDWKIEKVYHNNELTSSTPSNVSFMQQYHGFNQTGHEYVGNYHFLNRSSGTTTTSNNQWMYLSGGHYEDHEHRTYYEHSGIRISNGNHSLHVANFANNQAVSDTTPANSVVWVESGNGNNVKLYTTYNGTNYYLQFYNQTTLRISTSSSNGTTFSKQDNGNGGYRYVSGTYYLGYDNGWKMIDIGTTPATPSAPRPTTPVAQPTEPTIEHPGDAPAEPVEPQRPSNPTSYGTQLYYSDGNNNYFLKPTSESNGSSLTSSENVPYKGGWGWDSSNRRIYLANNNNLRLRHNNNNNLTIGNQTNASVQWTQNGSNPYTFSYETSSWFTTTTYYLRYNNGAYSCSTTNSQNSLHMVEWALTYDNQYMTMTDATTYTAQKTASYNSDYAAYQAYLAQYPTLVANYNAALQAYNDAWAQYNSDLAAYNTYVDTVNQWNQYDSDLAAYNARVAASYCLTLTTITPENPVLGPDSHQTSADTSKSNAESHMYYDYDDTTYFPLNVQEDGGTFANANAVRTAINSGNFDPKDSNTGYIVAGSNLEGLNSLSYENNRDDISKIRVSEYAISNVNASYNKTSGSSTTLDGDLPNSKIYTIDTSMSKKTMAQSISDNPNYYTRFNDSKLSFFKNSLATPNAAGTSFTTNENIYGLHFMNSVINDEAIVNARKVSILGNKCDSYQLPVNSIDFNLKQKGVINFFAGTYFSNNNSFFSLHEIVRNNDAVVKGDPKNKEFTSYNTISEIKDIVEIWGNDVGEKTSKYSNIYKYSDGTYSVPYRIDSSLNKYAMNKNNTTDTTVPYTYATMNSTDFNAYCNTYNYTLKFKTAQIGVNSSSISSSNKEIFYYEFPMNPGEYCLGSVDGGTGGYLLYLDIGANAAKTQRTTVYEHYAEIQKMFEYPAGVAVVAVSTVADNLANSRAIDETNTANFLIIAGTNGTITITRSANDVEVARTGGFTNNAKPTLVGDLMWDNTHQQYNIHKPSSEGSANISSEITSKDTVTEVRVLNYYDWNVNLEELTITRIFDTSTDGGKNWTRTFYQEYQDGTNTTDLSEMRIYHTINGTKYAEEDLSNPLTSEVKTYAGASETSVSTTLICKITYQEDNGEEVTQEWKLQLALAGGDSSGHYYIISTSGALYNLVATVNEGSVTLTVVSTGGRTIAINGTTVTSGSTVTLTPAP